MKIRNILLACLLMLLFTSGIVRAQTNDYLSCTEVEQLWVSPTDTLKVVNSFANPTSDTMVWIPFSASNVDSMSGFNVILKFDPTYLSPLVDTVVYNPFAPEGQPAWDTFYVFQALDRLAATQAEINSIEGYEVQSLQVRNSYNPYDDGAILAMFAYSPQLSHDYVHIDAGSGQLFSIGFRINSSMLDGETADFLFHDTNECVIYQATEICGDCRRTNFAVTRYAGVDTLTGDTIWQTSTVFPELLPGTFTASENPPPVINQFYADPASISSGSGTTLYWDVTNVDTVRISGPNLTNYETQNAVGQMGVSPPIVAGTYTYNLYAINEYATVQTSTIVTVTGGGGGDNTLPVISVTSAFTVEQAQPLIFTVSASDADADNINLSATNLPANANFPIVVGLGTVSGTFSWTPDVNQVGDYDVAFVADDGEGSSSATVRITVTPITVDRLFTTSAPGQSPAGGLSGKETVYVPIDLVTQATVYGVQFNFRYDNHFFEVDSFVVSSRIPDYVVYDNIGLYPGEIRVVTFGLANEPVVTDTTTAILYAVMSIDSLAVPGNYPIYISDGWESINPDPHFPSVELAVDSGIIQVDLPGDINLDQRIDVADLVSTVAYIIGDYNLDERRFEVADVIINDTVNVFDLVAIVNLIYGIPISPAPEQNNSAYMSTITLSYSDLEMGESDEMVVRSEIPVDIVGVEIEMYYDPAVVALGKPQLGKDAEKLNLSYRDNGWGKLVVLAYFMDPMGDEYVPAGNVELVTVPIIARSELESGNESQIRLTRVLMSTSEAGTVNVEGFGKPLPETFTLSQNYPNPFNPRTAIEFSLGEPKDGAADWQVNLDIYNVLGRHVKALKNERMLPGNYKVEWDATDDMGRKTATGVYFYRLMVGSESKSKKMLLLK